MDFPGGLAGKQFACNPGDLGLIPGLGRYPGEGNNYPLQYSDLENSMDCTDHGVAKSPDRTEGLSLSLNEVYSIGKSFIPMCPLKSHFPTAVSVVWLGKTLRLALSILLILSLHLQLCN